MNNVDKLPKARTDSGSKNQAHSVVRSESGKSSKKNSFLFPTILIVTGCVVFLFAAWSAVRSPAFASILKIPSSTAAVQTVPIKSFAQVEIAKPAKVAQALSVPATVTAIPTTIPTDIPVTEPEQAFGAPTVASTLEALVLPTDTPQVVVSQPETNSGAVAVAQIVQDTPTAEYTVPTVAPYIPAQASGNGGVHWIDVDLSDQRMYAYEGDTLVNSFIVSTGTWQTPTVTGEFKVWIKLRSSDMSGPGYYLPDVPFVMYFYKDYGIHGTYWHNNFGTPMSHGCVNLTIADAEWIYNFSSVGTVVNVHY